MDNDIVEYANTLSKEHKDRFIEYLKLYNSKNMDEFVERRKKIGVKNVRATSSSFQSFLMRILPTTEALEKLQHESQSHST